MPALSASDVTALVAKIKKFPYVCSVGSIDLGPLEGPPTISPETETTDVTLYETEGGLGASFLTKNDITITIRTRNIADGMALAASVKKGDNLFDSSLKKAITLVPITSATESTITFANAYLTSGLTFAPGENGQPSAVELTFTCKPDDSTGIPFTYGS